jgi:hypothetical protein
MHGNFDAMAEDPNGWARYMYVNGRTIFPKLPSHLRVYHRKWDFNSRLKEALMVKGLAVDALKTT